MTPEQVCEGKVGPFKWFIVFENITFTTMPGGIWVIVRTETEYFDYLLKRNKASNFVQLSTGWHSDGEYITNEDWKRFDRIVSKEYDTFEELMKDNFEVFL